MSEDTIKDVINDARGLALDSTTNDAALLRFGLERIAERLEELARGRTKPEGDSPAEAQSRRDDKPWEPLEIPACGIDFRRYHGADCEVYICAWKDGHISHVYEVRMRKVEEEKWVAVLSNDGRKLCTLSAPSRQLAYRCALGAMRAYLRRGHRKTIRRAEAGARPNAGKAVAE